MPSSEQSLEECDTEFRLQLVGVGAIPNAFGIDNSNAAGFIITKIRTNGRFRFLITKFNIFIANF
jgi:hypothetical protein